MRPDDGAVVRVERTELDRGPREPVRRLLGGGPVVGVVPCPICRSQVELRAERDDGRCIECTVIVRRVDGKVRACGWRGGDMQKAGAALRKLKPSKYEDGDDPDELVGGVCGDRVGTPAGAAAHYYKGERPCRDCRLAMNEVRREQKHLARVARAERLAREAAA